MNTCLGKQNFLLRHGSETFPLTSTKNQFSVFCSFTIIIIFSGSKRPWLINKFCLLRFSISFPMVSFFIKFDALTVWKIIFKQHMKYVSVNLFLKLTKF